MTNIYDHLANGKVVKKKKKFKKVVSNSNYLINTSVSRADPDLPVALSRTLLRGPPA